MAIKIIGIVCLAYFIYGISVFSFQRNVIFPRRHLPPASSSEIDIDNIKKIWLNIKNSKVEAWYMPSSISYKNKKRPAVIFSHGNAETIDYWAYMLSPYNALGVNVFLVEYPGYGRSGGRPSQKSITKTLIKAYDWLIENEDIDKANIIAHGRSVGGGASCALAKERNIKALIIQSTFTDLRQFAREFLMPSFLVMDPFDNLSVVKSFDGPVLIMHGKYDEMISYKNSVTLYENAKNGKLITYNCHHNDFPPDPDIYWKDINEFLQENGIILERTES